MAKKPKTPTPPRRVQAPKQRVDMDDLGLRHRATLYGMAALGIVGLVVVVLVVAFGGSKRADPSALLVKAGCTYKSVKTFVPPGQGVHVASLTKKFPWNTDPPAGGQHYPLWAVWGFYTEAVNPRMVVHNEEHGGVVLWWGPKVPASTVAKLREFYNEKSTGSFGTPYPKLGGKIAISAWTGNVSTYGQNGDFGTSHLAICPRFDDATKKAFEAFRDDFIGKGPEGVPLSADVAGMGPQ
jgi:hypothetical protein